VSWFEVLLLFSHSSGDGHGNVEVFVIGGEHTDNVGVVGGIGEGVHPVKAEANKLYTSKSVA
jgi:hypothetical protein